MRIGTYDFKPGLVPAVLTVLLLPAFLGLGWWQLERAAEKREILETREARAAERPLALDADVQVLEGLRYYDVEAEGRFDARRTFLLDNQLHEGRPGYHVVSPLVLAGGDAAVLVNRGWIPAEGSRDDPPTPAVPDGVVTVQGIADGPPGIGLRLGPPDGDGRGGWPRIVQYLDLEWVAHELDMEVRPVVVRLDPDAPHGFVRDWELVTFGPERHHAYAVQWFALAAVLIILFVALNIRPHEPNEDNAA